jgi:hypothetical protein
MANRIERPISISAVRDCLGVSTNSLKTLCRSEAIAEWAKYKPNRIADNPSIRPANWWQADQNSGNDCGFSLPIFSLNTGALNNTNLKNKFTADGKNGWNYNRVSGSYKNRLLDFEGYYHLAAPPFDLITNTINVYEGTESVTIQPAKRAYQGDDVLKFRDFAFAASTPYYLGAFLVGKVGNTNYYKRHISSYEVTSDSSGDLSGNINNLPTLPISDLPVGTYTIYTIIGSESVGYDEGSGIEEEPDIQISVLPCPCVPPITLNVVAKDIVFTFTIGGSIKSNRITYDFTFKNASIEDVTITEIKFSFLPNGADSAATNYVTEIDAVVPMGTQYSPPFQQVFDATSGYTNPCLQVEFKVKNNQGQYLNEYGDVGNVLFTRTVNLRHIIG